MHHDFLGETFLRHQWLAAGKKSIQKRLHHHIMGMYVCVRGVKGRPLFSPHNDPFCIKNPKKAREGPRIFHNVYRTKDHFVGTSNEGFFITALGLLLHSFVSLQGSLTQKSGARFTKPFKQNS